jgi:hypothetical protein
MAYETLAFLSALFDGGAVAGDGPQDLQALGADPAELPPADARGDAAGPAAAASDPGDAGPSWTDRPAGQALPGADPLGADGPQDDHGDAAQALQPHGIDAAGPAPLQPHGDAGPQAMPRGQTLGAQVAEMPPTEAHGDAGGADGPQDLAAVRQATAAPRTRPAVPVAVEWPAAAADFCLLLAPDALPPVPFRLNAWTEVRDGGKFLRWLQADARRGPSGPRAFYGALQADLQALQRFALQAAAVPSGIVSDPVTNCSDCGRRVVGGQPDRPSGLCFACWGKRR